MRPHIPKAVRQRVRQASGDCCGYCRTPQHLSPAPLEVEHLIPRGCGGSDDEQNLWLSCRICNSYKGKQVTGVDPTSGAAVALFDPRRQRWDEHFCWSSTGETIVGMTPSGRATVQALQMNNPLSVLVRRYWITAGWHPPKQ